MPLCPEAPRGWICTKFGLWGPLADVINCAEFCCSRLMGFDSGLIIVSGYSSVCFEIKFSNRHRGFYGFLFNL